MSLMTHLWQSTLCACVAALLAFALRRASARARHSVWLLASIKFLIPFSALVLVGGYVGRWTSAFATSDVSLAVRRLGETLPRWTLEVASGYAVLDGPNSAVVDQAENRLHAQRALLLELIGESTSERSAR